MRGVLLAIVVVAACWTGDAPSPPKSVPPPVAKSAERPAKSDPVQTLEKALRDDGANLLPRLLEGPFVVGDVDTGTIASLCGIGAVSAARDWGAKVQDARRRASRCFGGRGWVECIQGGTDTVMLVFDRAIDPHLKIAMTSSRSSSSFAAFIMRTGKVLATASCP
jgi:hypothetical protein